MTDLGLVIIKRCRACEKYGLQWMFNLWEGVVEQTQLGPSDAVCSANRADLDELKAYLAASFIALHSSDRLLFSNYFSSRNKERTSA